MVGVGVAGSSAWPPGPSSFAAVSVPGASAPGASAASPLPGLSGAVWSPDCTESVSGPPVGSGAVAGAGEGAGLDWACASADPPAASADSATSVAATFLICLVM